MTRRTIGQRIRDWDDYVEDHDREQATKPFDAGIMLAVATLFDAWDEIELPKQKVTPKLREAIKDLRDTAVTVVAR